MGLLLPLRDWLVFQSSGLWGSQRCDCLCFTAWIAPCCARHLLGGGWSVEPDAPCLCTVGARVRDRLLPRLPG